jgi:hypothetical protein
MNVKARFGLLAAAAALTAGFLPAPAHASSAGLYLMDRQGASGVLRGAGTSYAFVTAYGENFRGAFVPSLTFPLSSHSEGCVSFHGAQIQEACGLLSVTVDQALSSAEITGVLAGVGFTLTVNLTLTADAIPPEPYARSSVDDENLCNPPKVTCPYVTAGLTREATTSGTVTSSTLGTLALPDVGDIYAEVFWELDVLADVPSPPHVP